MKYSEFLKIFFLSSFLATGLAMTGPAVEWTGLACGHCGSPVHPDVATEPLRCEDCLFKPDHGGEG